MGRRTPAVSRPGQGRVPESGQGECHAASFFPRLLPPASGAEMQIGDAGGGRGGAGVGWGEVTDSIHRSGHLHRCAVARCSNLDLTFTGCRRRGADLLPGNKHIGGKSNVAVKIIDNTYFIG